MEDRLGQAIKLAKRSGNRVGLLAIDLDGFKQINDTLGHPVGDVVLATIANRLQASVRGSDTVIRIGGDEFLVIAQDHAYPHGIGILAQKLLDCVRAPVFVDGKDLLITCSIGTALYPDDGATCKDMLSRADAAMYLSKRQGKNCVTPAEAHTEIA
jgi:diguanylate cyclase (GGDEF)-like protein